MKSNFENQLRTHWQARNFEAWNQIRGIYADWLGDRMDPLWYFASLPMKCVPYTFQWKKAYRWQLYAKVDRAPTIGWLGCVNRRSLLGVPPTCFKLTWFDRDINSGAPYPLSFSVIFKPRCSDEKLAMVPRDATRRQLDSLGIYFKFDTRHPLGLAGIVMPSEMRDYTDEGLFETCQREEQSE